MPDTTELHRDTVITYLGHSTILLKSPGGKRILIDPWTKGNPACPLEWKDPARLGSLDIILATHIHNDHVGDAELIGRANPRALFVGIFEACNWIKTKGVDNIRPMSKGGSQSIAGIEITMTHAIHSSSYEAEDGSVVYGGEPAGYILRMENGFTLYAAGDTGLFGDMSLIADIYQPELAFLPIGDLFTMGPMQAAHAARLLKVRHVVPIHYATFAALTGTVDAFKHHASNIADLQVHELRPGQSFS